ncbi:MAG: hypothetical protein OHK0032_12910 [Thermodesulfovibrionales bacterium]
MIDKMKIDKIILAIDNSAVSMVAAEAALGIAKSFGSDVVGIHGYNASMHEGAFRIMEPTLPARYQREEILKRQRDTHNKLINVGMEKISLSYLKPLEDTFRAAGINFKIRVKEGKNFMAVNELLSEQNGDFIVIGSAGFNSNGSGFIGSVCLRVLRSNDRNFLVVKKGLNLSNPRLVVCLDGSTSAVGALRMAKLFVDKCGAEIHLIYVFDSTLHREVFARLKESLISREGFSFNSKEQERLHDEFIDRGLARVGNMILDRAEKEVFSEAVSSQQSTVNQGLPIGDGWSLVGDDRPTPRIKKVLEGHIYKKICAYASEVNADLIFVGRTGRHFTEGMDIGSVAENVVRFSPCSVFVAMSQEYRGWEL